MTRKRGTVVVADGDDGARGMAVETLMRGGFGVIEVAGGAEALAAADDRDVRLVILEVALPDMTGYEVCQELRRVHGEELVIFFLAGTHSDPIDRAAGLLFGADDFIVKPFDANEFMARVSRFVTRAFSTPAPVVHHAAAETLPRLTEREREVLTLLARGEGQKKIALELSISTKTVSTHIQHLHAKLGVHSRAELVAYAYRAGLVMAEVDAPVAIAASA
jgi:DNA-binding NarL/FixJ family response regulator